MSLFRLALLIVIVSVVVLAAVDTSSISVLAQKPSPWMPDERVPGFMDDTFTPYLFADENRTVHVFAGQRIDEESEKTAIFYRQWTLENGWATANDVLLSPAGNAQITGALIDSAGVMHVAFWGGDARYAAIYYTRAAATEAGQAHAWSKPRMVGRAATSPHSGALVGDDKGNLILIYNGVDVGNGVYVAYSSDAGENWVEPQPLYLTYEPKSIPFGLDMNLGVNGQVHAVWNVVSTTGQDLSLHYARLDVASQMWLEPIVLDERIDQKGFFGPSFPKVVDNGSKVIVMYNNGNPNADGPVPMGRPVQQVRISDDGGNSWRGPITPFPSQLGRSGEFALILDGDGVVHSVFMQRIEQIVDGKIEVIDGPWHSEFRNDIWFPPTNFVATVAPHDIRAVVSQGNVLFSIWRQDPGLGNDGIWYSYRVLDAPELSVVALPTVAPSSTPMPYVTSTPVRPTPTPTAALSWDDDERKPVAIDPTAPLAIAVAPVIVVVVGTIVLRRRARRHR